MRNSLILQGIAPYIYYVYFLLGILHCSGTSVVQALLRTYQCKIPLNYKKYFTILLFFIIFWKTNCRLILERREIQNVFMVLKNMKLVWRLYLMVGRSKASNPPGHELKFTKTLHFNFIPHINAPRELGTMP